MTNAVRHEVKRIKWIDRNKYDPLYSGYLLVDDKHTAYCSVDVKNGSWVMHWSLNGDRINKFGSANKMTADEAKKSAIRVLKKYLKGNMSSPYVPSLLSVLEGEK